jgi:hypothetical protein
MSLFVNMNLLFRLLQTQWSKSFGEKHFKKPVFLALVPLALLWPHSASSSRDPRVFRPVQLNISPIVFMTKSDMVHEGESNGMVEYACCCQSIERLADTVMLVQDS